MLFDGVNFIVEVGRLVASPSSWPETIAVVIQVEVGARDSMFVQIDPIDASHEHESSAP